MFVLNSIKTMSYHSTALCLQKWLGVHPEEPTKERYIRPKMICKLVPQTFQDQGRNRTPHSLYPFLGWGTRYASIVSLQWPPASLKDMFMELKHSRKFNCIPVATPLSALFQIRKFGRNVTLFTKSNGEMLKVTQTRIAFLIWPRMLLTVRMLAPSNLVTSNALLNMSWNSTMNK